MIEELPLYISMIFVATTLLAVFIFYRAAQYSKLVLAVVSVWLLVQLYLGLTAFYTVTVGFPPRFILLGLPPLLLIITIFSSAKGKLFIDGLDMKYLTYLHTIRVPIEIVLYWLFIAGHIPQVMTFLGSNLDILAGLTAPVVAYFGFTKRLISKNILLIWNILSLGLLLTIVTIAVLSAPTSFQQYGFDQPNTAVLYFPFVWLPSCIVPIVLFSQLATIKKLVSSNVAKARQE